MRGIDWFYGVIVCAVAALSSGCINYRLRAELSGEEIQKHEEHITVKESEPYLCRWYKFADCPKTNGIEGS